MQFSKVLGNKEIKSILSKAVDRETLPHALLIGGRQGVPSLQLALSLTTYIFCENKQENGDSCGVCGHCVKMEKLIHPDLALFFPTASTKKISTNPTSESFQSEFRDFVKDHPFGDITQWFNFVGAENKLPQISVAEARKIVGALSLKPFIAPWKVVLLWLPEFMNTAAANAILKVLEEPSPKTLFLFVCNDFSKLLPTIYSRLQRVLLPPLNEEVVIKYLTEVEEIEATEARTLSFLSENNITEALQLKNEGGSGDFFSLYTNWMRTCFSWNLANYGALTDMFSALGREGQRNFIHYSLKMLRECLLVNHEAESILRLPESEKAFLQKFAPFLDENKLAYLLRTLSEAAYQIERSASAKILFYDLSLKVSFCLKPE